MEKMEVKFNEELSQFEMDFDGKKALVGFKKETDGTLNLVHTEVPPEFEGKGVGSQLVKQTLEQIKTTNKKIIPSCPFVAAYIKRHPEYESLVK
jgi:predicted GNAT family acetyltransferase